MINEIREDLCPFCKRENQCMIHRSEQCWCYDVVIPSELTALVPAEMASKACICLECVNLFNKDPLRFKTKYLRK
ncbi:cysteine-rich CWC family protein [uncultured Desulfuromusa sp.]|uniref:cysteine-rich CWC family protein n=1 Tax=uncultured Desulfuromusa sp. TaxID=219183 RepID=UPI003747DCAC